MRLLYEAQNSIEAHMILNLLEQQGLSARIDGEYLQGGMGELPAGGLVRVMIEEEHYAAGRKAVQEWEAEQPDNEPAVFTSKKSSFRYTLLGFLIGVAATAVYYHRPIPSGYDYNGDGTLDENWIVINGLVNQSEIDTNFDGEVDTIHYFDFDGLADTSSLDIDFNGTFETLLSYDKGSMTSQQSDTTGNGFYDYRLNFKYEEIETAEYFDPETERLIKIEEFGDFKLDKAQIDTDGDGVMDTFYKYDALGEIEARSSQPIN